MKWFADTFLSDALLIGFAVFMLFVFALILITPDHIIGVGESNLVILSLEIAVCVFAVVWSSVRVTRNIRRERTR